MYIYIYIYIYMYINSTLHIISRSVYIRMYVLVILVATCQQASTFCFATLCRNETRPNANSNNCSPMAMAQVFQGLTLPWQPTRGWRGTVRSCWLRSPLINFSVTVYCISLHIMFCVCVRLDMYILYTIVHRMGLHMCVLDVYARLKSRNCNDMLVTPRRTYWDM